MEKRRNNASRVLFGIAVEKDPGITSETRFIAVTGLRERALLYEEEETVAFLLTIALRRDGSGGERDALADVAVKGLGHIKAEQRLKELIKEKAERLECKVLALEVMPDHVHLFIEGKPLQTPNYIIGQIKGY